LHLYFIESDINEFEKFKFALDDDLMMGNAQAGFVIYNKYQQRLEERINFTFDILKTEMSFEIIDSFLFKREEVPFAKNLSELDKLWINKVKYEVLALKADGKEYKACAEIVRKRYYNLF
jgi:carboxyl-terminal processing protease